jgi:hypothetical protein
VYEPVLRPSTKTNPIAQQIFQEPVIQEEKIPAMQPGSIYLSCNARKDTDAAQKILDALEAARMNVQLDLFTPTE